MQHTGKYRPNSFNSNPVNATRKCKTGWRFVVVFGFCSIWVWFGFFFSLQLQHNHTLLCIFVSVPSVCDWLIILLCVEPRIDFVAVVFGCCHYSNCLHRMCGCMPFSIRFFSRLLLIHVHACDMGLCALYVFSHFRLSFFLIFLSRSFFQIVLMLRASPYSIKISYFSVRINTILCMCARIYVSKQQKSERLAFSTKHLRRVLIRFVINRLLYFGVEHAA